MNIGASSGIAKSSREKVDGQEYVYSLVCDRTANCSASNHGQDSNFENVFVLVLIKYLLGSC